MPSIFDLFNDDFFKSMMDFDTDRIHPYSGNEKVCPGCGTTFSDFNRTGKFGCGQCYETFAERVEPLIKRIQGSTDYQGSVPARGSGVFRTKHQIKRLRQELQKAVDAEDFEKAMVLRDQIKDLETMLAKK